MTTVPQETHREDRGPASAGSDIAAFFSRCTVSSHAAYEALKSILERLDDPRTRQDARIFLTAVRETLESAPHAPPPTERYHFSIDRLATDGSEEAGGSLLLLQLPSIFSPEEWSFTFYEGLARYSTAEFQGRIVAELGCGNGWISLALAKRSAPTKIFGLDINPRAIVCARINLYMNALNDSGHPVPDAEGKSLLDRVEFHTSDLLGVIGERKILLDRVIGCIPQVLNPEPMAATKIVAENESDAFLYDLSNYCEKQGYVEDQFGLGLIARALEESVENMKPSAKVILNMGGRPGSAVLERLFTRRGFTVKKVWTTKVVQAHDTDIEPLVEIERSTPHRFEFFMGQGSDAPVSARTAQRYAAAGGEISHALTVYEAQLRNPIHTKKILRLLNTGAYDDARSALDLAFDDESIADEKSSFLASLADRFATQSYFPYEETEGESNFRRRIAEYMRSYWRVPVTAKNILVAPNRASAIKNIFNLYRPRLALADKEFSRDLPQAWTNARTQSGHDAPAVLEIPRRVEQTCRLLSTLGPSLVITSLADFEAKTADSFVRLLDATERAKARLVVDISPFFDLSSTPESNGVLSYLSENSLPTHATIICGLVKNRVYADLEICFVVSENKTFLDAMAGAAEFTYSRAPLLSQNYYDRILFDLINFQMKSRLRDRATQPRLPREESLPGFDALSPGCLRSFEHPSVSVNGLPITKQTLRLDYGENCLPTPGVLREGLLEAFVRQNLGPGDANFEAPLERVLQDRFGLSPGRSPEAHVIASSGVAPLYASLAELCREQDGTLIFPRGSYGHFVAAADFFGTRTLTIATRPEDAFKLTPKMLHEALKGTARGWVFLNGPIVNPTGALYTSAEAFELISVAYAHGARVVLDTIFSGLEFVPSTDAWMLDDWIASLGHVPGTQSGLSLVLLGGISKEFAAGGLRLGFAQTRDADLAARLKRAHLCPPHQTLRYAAKKAYAQLGAKEPEVVSDLAQQRAVLRGRAARLTQVLTEAGWDVIPPSGGLFMVASPTRWVGRQIRIRAGDQMETVTVSHSNVAETLFRACGVLVNDEVWTGIPGHCRFVLSVEEGVFDAALERLRALAGEIS